MNRKTYNILEVAGLFYCFAISLVASTGHIVVKIARVILFLAFIMDLAKNKGQKSNDSSYSKWIIVLYILIIMSNAIYYIIAKTLQSRHLPKRASAHNHS